MDSIIGILAKDWLEVLKQNHFRIHIGQTPKALLITFLSRRNTVDHQKEEERYGADIEKTQIDRHPIFILGHWRSGTTFLQNLMTRDQQFVSPNIFEARNPHTFLIRHKIFENNVRKQRAMKRPTDNVQISMDSPGEEDFAVGVMSLCTPLLGWMFPKNRDFYERFLTFEEATGDELERWKFWYLYYLKKLTFKHKKPLLLKSPVNTARIKHLIQMFPEARFVHIHRHPFDVYRSTEKMYRTAVRNSAIQHFNGRDITDDIIDHYQRMHRVYFRDRSLIPAGQLLEIGFAQLESDPLGTLRTIYRELNISGFSEAEPAFRSYLEQLQNYQKNQHGQLREDLKVRLLNAWRQSFENWGYEA